MRAAGISCAPARPGERACCSRFGCSGGRRRGRDAIRPNPCCRIKRDGRITLVVGHSEMGQGVRTSLAMILAEELEADWASVAIRQASPGPGYTDLGTGGSGSIEDSWKPLRVGRGRGPRDADRGRGEALGLPASACRAESAAVFHPDSGRKLGYGALAASAAALPVPKDPRLKERKDFRLVGREIPRIDGPAIVSGRATFGMDVRVPGMLFAAVARCPVPGGKPARFDSAKAMAVPGVRKVVEVSTGVAVLATDTFAALSGRDALATAWDEGANAALSTEELNRKLDDPSSSPHSLHATRKQGDVGVALAAAATRMSASYRDGFQAHASVERRTARPASPAAGARSGPPRRIRSVLRRRPPSSSRSIPAKSRCT